MKNRGKTKLQSGIAAIAKESLHAKLEGLLRQMNVPKQRLRDYAWLSKNLATKNKLHQKFPEAKGLVSKLLKMENEQ